jgi:pimeloyl-ACP methyl ester carboxylesterase
LNIAFFPQQELVILLSKRTLHANEDGDMTISHVLFLHAGPGMTAELERQRFGATLPVNWWDQPHVRADVLQPFDALVHTAASELKRMAKQSGTRISLLANSFGAYLARALVDEVPEHIGSIIICGGIFDLRVSFLRLGRKLAKLHPDPALETALQSAADAGTPDAYWMLIGCITATPGFLDYYWSPRAIEQLEAMNTIATQGNLIHMETFQSVVMSMLLVPQQRSDVVPIGGVRILIGRYDPYYEASDTNVWQKIWPHASVEIVDAGHFPHLELAPAVWMPNVIP